ncbi:hypothetical protein B0H14DRAFT_2613116 [Mycena olivaceomarginata]|nr:hypothetical protein B0H14DRAFT_2613116 [Mycena olivaceomarginata]
MKYTRKLSKRNPDIVNGCFVALNLTGKSTNYSVAPWRELVSVVDTLPSARQGILNLWLPQLKMSHETQWVKEWWMIWTSVQWCRWRLRSPNINSNMRAQDMKAGNNPVPATEYEEPVNGLEYAGPIYEPDSFGVPMEYPPNLDARPVDFPSDVLVNPIESAAGLDDFNMEDIFPNFDPQVFDFGSTYDLPPLPAPPAFSPPAPVVTEGMQSTRKCKTRELEVNVRNIIPESVRATLSSVRGVETSRGIQSDEVPGNSLGPDHRLCARVSAGEGESTGWEGGKQGLRWWFP